MGSSGTDLSAGLRHLNLRRDDVPSPSGAVVSRRGATSRRQNIWAHRNRRSHLGERPGLRLDVGGRSTGSVVGLDRGESRLDWRVHVAHHAVSLRARLTKFIADARTLPLAARTWLATCMSRCSPSSSRRAAFNFTPHSSSPRKSDAWKALQFISLMAKCHSYMNGGLLACVSLLILFRSLDGSSAATRKLQRCFPFLPLPPAVGLQGGTTTVFHRGVDIDQEIGRAHV